MAHFPPASQRPQVSEEPQSRQGQSAVLSNVPLPTAHWRLQSLPPLVCSSWGHRTEGGAPLAL